MHFEQKFYTRRDGNSKFGAQKRNEWGTLWENEFDAARHNLLQNCGCESRLVPNIKKLQRFYMLSEDALRLACECAMSATVDVIKCVMGMIRLEAKEFSYGDEYTGTARGVFLELAAEATRLYISSTATGIEFELYYDLYDI